MWGNLSNVLRATLVVLTLIGLWQGVYPYVFQGVLALVAALLSDRLIGDQAPKANFLAHQGLFLHTGGNVLGWYNAYEGSYDKLAHVVGTWAMVAVSATLLPARLAGAWRQMMLVLIGISAGALWEIGEFLTDQSAGSLARLMEVGRRMQPGLSDTMWDLMADVGAAIAAGLWLGRQAPQGGVRMRELLFGSTIHVHEGNWGSLGGLIVNHKQITHLVASPNQWSGQMIAIPMAHLDAVGPRGDLYVGLHSDQLKWLPQRSQSDWPVDDLAVSVILIDPALLPHPTSEPVEPGALLLTGQTKMEGHDQVLGSVIGARLDDGHLTHVAIRHGWPLNQEIFVPIDQIEAWKSDRLATHLSEGNLERLSRP